MILYVRAAAFAVTVVVAVTGYLWTRANNYRAHREMPLNVAPSQNDRRTEPSGSSLNPTGSQNIRICIICDESLNSDEPRITLEACNHTFHKICLRSYEIIRQLGNQNAELVCPFESCRAPFATQ